MSGRCKSEVLLWMPRDPPPAPDPDRMRTPAQSPFLLSQAVTNQRGDLITLLLFLNLRAKKKKKFTRKIVAALFSVDFLPQNVN